MGYANKSLKRNSDGITVPQYYNPITDDYEVVEGAGGSFNVYQSGSYVRLSTEPKPTSADGVNDGDDLLIVDTKDVYIYYKGTWYLQ